jgi:hypothetical protein
VSEVLSRSCKNIFEKVNQKHTHKQTKIKETMKERAYEVMQGMTFCLLLKVKGSHHSPPKFASNVKKRHIVSCASSGAHARLLLLLLGTHSFPQDAVCPFISVLQRFPPPKTQRLCNPFFMSCYMQCVCSPSFSFFSRLLIHPQGEQRSPYLFFFVTVYVFFRDSTAFPPSPLSCTGSVSQRWIPDTHSRRRRRWWWKPR